MLSPAQLQTLKADILADQALSVLPNTPDANYQIAQAYNLLADPVWVVWKTMIPTSDIKKAMVWTEYVGRSTGEQNAFALMIADGVINASDVNVRAGFADIFSGPNGATTRANLTALAKRSATRAEQLFSTGTGSDASPATLTFEGGLSHHDVQQARDLA